MKKRVHVVSYTHWDREFRWQFELTRMKLVDCLDRMLEMMEQHPDYEHFLLDGQISLLDDYLEIRPEKEAYVRELIAADRLELGPWYTLPDCGTLNGECVVRNLQYGRKVSQAYGNVLNCGYNVFSFGQIGQLPQIYDNFGIDVIIFYKYMNPVRSELPEFIWEAPDGTRVLSSRLGREARWNFFFAGHIPIVYDRDPWHKDWKYDYGSLGKVIHPATPEDYPWFHEILDPETSFHKENIKAGFERTLESLEGTAAPDNLLFFDGTDFTEPHPLTPAIIGELRKQCGDDYEILHSKLDDYLTELKVVLKDDPRLQVVSGPMRDGPVGAVHSDVLTIHPEIKLANAKAENKLIRSAEPLSSLVFAEGISEYPSTYLERTWKLLFQSHAHDSLHGLGPKELSRAGVARIEQAEIIAQGLERRALMNLTKEIKTDTVDDASTFLAVHNTAAFPRSEVVDTWVDIPAEVTLENVVIEDMAGNSCQVQEISRESTRAGIYHPRSRNMPFYCTRVHLLFWADDIPAMGYKTFKIKWETINDYPYPHDDWEAPRLISHDLVSSPVSAANDLIALAIAADGTFTVTDKQTGQAYSNLNYLLESGDCGNMWMSKSPDQDVIVQSLGKAAEIACIQRGELEARFIVKTELDVPARFDFGTNLRSTDTVALAAVCELTLRKGSRYVGVKTTIDNSAEDHYLKICFPTGLDAKMTAADGSFSVTEYSSAPDLSCELARHPAQLWFDTGDGSNGLAVLLKSTKDYEILDEPSGRTMAMGLVRSVRVRIPCDNRLWMDYPGDQSAQSLSSTEHHYAILPHAGTWKDADLYTDALSFNQPLKTTQFANQDGRLPTAKEFIKITDSRLVLSAVSKAVDSDDILVRLFNPQTQDIATDIVIGFPAATAKQVKMSEESVTDLPLKDGTVSLTVGKGKILTLAFSGVKCLL